MMFGRPRELCPGGVVGVGSGGLWGPPKAAGAEQHSPPCLCCHSSTASQGLPVFFLYICVWLLSCKSPVCWGDQLHLSTAADFRGTRERCHLSGVCRV